jgi:anti-sigma-K factor RskA
MSDSHALSGAYAVDALDADERQSFEKHLEVCPECRAEVRSFSETAALMAEAQAETPPPSLRDSVLSGITSVRPLPPETAPVTPTEDPASTEVTRTTPATMRTLPRRLFPALVAASVAVILLAVGALVWQPWSGPESTSLADRIMAAPDAVSVTEPVPGGGELTIVRSASLKRAVMVGKDVPAPEPGTTYQLWLLQPGEGMVSAGLMTDVAEPTVLTGDAATAKAAAVSVEPETGSAHPTSDPLALFPLRTTGKTGST